MVSGIAATPRKGVIIILDGLGDRPCDQLSGHTPLEAAHTPNLDALAAAGEWGFVSPVPEGGKAQTHLGVGLLFGMQTGDATAMARGPIEAAGLGWQLGRDDLVIRGNFATLEPDGEGFRLLDRRAGRIDSGTGELAAVLQDLDLGDGVRADFAPTQQHRGVLRLSGGAFSAAVSDTDPGDVALPVPLPPCQPLADDRAARRTAALINRFTAMAHSRLQDHPVNRSRRESGLLPASGVIGRGAGFMPKALRAPGHDRLRVAVVAGCRTVLGLSRLLGFEVVEDDRFSADLHSDFEAKVRAVIRAVRDHDLVYLHIKAPDICAHDRDPLAKRAILERFDAAIAPLLKAGYVVGVCADHGTDSNTGWHIDDPVPSLLCDHRPTGRGWAAKFGERACADGPLGEIDVQQFLQRTLAAMGVDARQEKSA